MKKEIIVYGLILIFCMAILLPAFAETAQNIPDILQNAVLAEPLPTDIQEEEVLSATQEWLVEDQLCTAQQAASLEYQAFFLYHEQFNQGTIPVWIVYMLNEGAVVWKAAYGYNGYPMSLVPYEQDFECFQLPNENFWDNTYPGWDRWTELQAFAALFEGTLSFEQRVQTAERWKPYVEQWINDHPYYMNQPGFEYTITMEETYGIPDENALSEQEAIKLAKTEVIRMGADAATVDTRTVKADYFVTDAQNPVWALWFSSVRAKGMSVEEKRSDITNTSSFQVKIHAYSGAVVSSYMDSPI